MVTLVEIPPQWSLQLAQGADAMRLTLSPSQRQLLLGYLGLLARWNRTYNLTAVRDPALMVRRQLLDSLSILSWVDRGPVLDVGTGAGLPGIPLAIARPDLNFSLLDTNSKKTRFVQQVVGELALPNVEVIKSRVESLDRPGHYALIAARAVASLAEIVTLTGSLLAPGGRWLLMKGTEPQQEIAALPSGLSAEVHRLPVPGERAARHLVVVYRSEHPPAP